jgi:hypothetical protein
MTEYLLKKFDDRPVQAAVIEKYIPAGEIWCMRGVAFIPSELGSRLGPSDDALLIGTSAYPAWSLSQPRPVV